MSNRLRTILIGAVGVIVVLLAGLFSGALDGVLRQLNVRIAGHPTSVASTNVVATPAPAKTDAASASTTPSGETVVPIFDLVRVEPTGDAVIAGRSDPNAKVEILSGKDVVADGKANDTGSWAIVLADPLKPGAHDLSVRVVGKDGKIATSEQSVAVSVPEGGNGDVLVVLNQPGSPSTVLQVPGLEEAQAKLADAGVDPAQAVEATPAVVPEPPKAAATPPPAVEPPTSASATATAIAGNETTPATTAEPAPAAMAAEPAAPVATPTPATVQIPAPPAEMLAAAAKPALPPAPAPASAVPATEPAAPQAVQPAAEATPAQAAPTAEPSVAPKAEPAAVPARVVTIDAVELENGKRFYAAGSAESGAVIRLYVDDKSIGDTKADKGRWLYQGEVQLAPGKHIVRIDQIGANGAVLARAEVPFQIAEDGLTAPTLASGVGSAQAGAGSSGEAKPAEPATLIIRRGDNLWVIAKRLYGKGIRYSTIYQANTDQIRNPDLIYPGQVFVVPEGDSAWKPMGQ
ncbi:LysM peptidoglycan-binding domain-containing protein [Pleomorphomonas sp. PLEO]|uniref:LysM peptidoglycan-binding domain-containing protein n=1 Tax=Pleomorphomonas sp. PLEO TaxID=3239306 RepID=UPI00351E6490